VLGGEFLSNTEASRLRRLLQSKGREAVVDEQGYVKVPVGREAAAAAAAGAAAATPSRVRRTSTDTNAPATDSTTTTSSSSSGVSPESQERPQAQQQQQQQQQQATGLPIVRPNDGDKGTFFSLSSWKRVGASPAVQQALQQLGITRPSHIQVRLLQVKQAGTRGWVAGAQWLCGAGARMQHGHQHLQQPAAMTTYRGG
jgi:hypothetical protein